MKTQTSIALTVFAAFAASCDGISSTGGFGVTQPPPPTAAQLAFTVQPTSVAPGAPMTPAVQVAIQSSAGATIGTATNTISIGITGGTGSPGALLGGTTTVAAVNGVATFSNLTIDRSGAAFTLTASSTGLTSATSTAFNVNP